mgnify:CR=1 FL=1|jgi:uncharacterized protein YdeI (YjbR/CyaY-like superfamily)
MATVATNAKQRALDYIESLPPFSKTICKKLRSIILKADKELQEDWKWGPNYSCHGMVCGYAGFKEHVKLTFFNGSALKDPKGLFNHCVDNEFNRSIKYTDVKEIDEAALTALIKEAIAVNKKGFKRVVKNKTIEVPADLQKALAKNKPALKYFDGLTYGYRKEYVEYVTEAKREETRQQRIAKIVELCASGKTLNDKYKK